MLVPLQPSLCDIMATPVFIDGLRSHFPRAGQFESRVAVVGMRVDARTRPGVVAAWGVWWPKLAPGGHNVNAVTSQRLTDLGRGPTFYDCLVDVVAEEEVSDSAQGAVRADAAG